MKLFTIKISSYVAGASIIFIFSCGNNKLINQSEKQYTPLPKVGDETYKSPQLRADQNSDNALGVSISGGGSRAQYFGLGVLMGLDELNNNTNSILNEVDYFSTVSGGGFAVGYYMSLRKNSVLDNYNSLFDYWKSSARKDTLQEFLYKPAKLTSILKLKRYEKNRIKKSYPYMIDWELLQYPKVYRGRKMERLYLSHFFIPTTSNEKVELPIFVANGTIYKNGERLPFMPHILKSIGINGSLIPEESFNLTDSYDFPLNYAIASSAAFPGVLPISKFTIEGKSDKVIRVLDGGAVDNLGFTTLFELLNKDQSKVGNKNMLIVDCDGTGPNEREQNMKRIKIGKLLRTSLLYNVNIKLLYSPDDIKVLAKNYDIAENNICRIGFSTIKKKFSSLKITLGATTANDIKKIQSKIEDGKLDWEDLYRDLSDNNSFSGFGVSDLSEIPTSRFSSFTAEDVFLIYELSSQVVTKIKIYDWEKEILVLAGRYSVFLEKSKILTLVD